MSETFEGSGRCICGAVKFTATSAKTDIGACHCKTCRQWSSGPWMASDCGQSVEFENADSMGVYQSSKWAERGYCKQCGTHLFYRLKGNSQTLMSAGLFDDQSQFNFHHQVFIDEKPSYYCFAEDTVEMTGFEVFARYAPKEIKNALKNKISHLKSNIEQGLSKE